jgi:hypothetical protein
MTLIKLSTISSSHDADRFKIHKSGQQGLTPIASFADSIPYVSPHNPPKIIFFPIGSICAGDEKLFHHTGGTKDIRFVPSKPARIGLWFYELAIPLSSGAQYLLYTKLLPVATIVRYWCYIIISYPDNQTMLLFDRYYMYNSSKVILEQSGVIYLASFNPFRFKAVEEDLEPKVTKEGEWAGLYNHPLLVSQ